jgi:hypothetical protein
MSDGLRLVLLVAAPLAGAWLTHELRRARRAALVAAAASIAVCAGLTASIAAGVAGGGSLERSLGTAIAGVDITARADSASVAVILAACLAAAVALPRHRDSGERLAGLLLCLAGTAAVAAGGNLLLVAAGVEVIAGGALLLSGGRGPGRRSAVVVAGVIGGAAVALVAAAAQLVAGAGSSDLAFVPQGAVGGALAVPWAMAGAALLISPVLLGDPGSPARQWAAVGTLPSGYLVLLRLQESAGGQLPAGAAAALSVIGGAVAVFAAVDAMRAATLAAAGRAGVAVVVGVLVSLFGGPLATEGTVLAGLFLALELAVVAAPAWGGRGSALSAASVGVLALPGGLAFAVAVTGLGLVASRGAGAFPQLAVLCTALTAAAVAAARGLATPPRGWRPVAPGSLLAVAAALAGGLLPGLFLRQVAAPLAGGGAAVDLDAGALQAPGGGFAAGYFALAAAVLVAAAAAAVVVTGDGAVARAVARTPAASMPRLGPLLRLRRMIASPAQRASTGLSRFDHWLESQPQLPLFVVAAAAAVLLFR